MTTKARRIVVIGVWTVVLLAATMAALYRGASAHTFVEGTLYTSLGMGLLGFIYFIGGATGDAFPPYTVVDLNASQNLRGQPLDHGRGALPKFTLGVVVMVTAAIPALVSIGILYFMSCR